MLNRMSWVGALEAIANASRAVRGRASILCGASREVGRQLTTLQLTVLCTSFVHSFVHLMYTICASMSVHLQARDSVASWKPFCINLQV